ncbi:DUF4362 domain-containing protein [Mesobacillus jeotgali]|uniref:DUF4362 domain-containing protein n=1 Tax=Mesobacillus jeotgali TaxID=129985 RepID=UPI000C815086|nr:DUF4362 domain-containing protein [Mesobacillus jeotgali]
MKRWLRIMMFFSFMLAGCEEEEQTHVEEVKKIKPPDYIQEPGDVVDMHGDITNLEKFYSFVEHVEQRKKDEIRIVSYTTEGAPMLHNPIFDGEKIHSTYDSTRDGYGSGSIEETSCAGIAEVNTGGRTDYILEDCSNPGGKDLTILVVVEK